MAENKKSVLLYSDMIHMVEKLKDDQAGKLLKHILRYVNDQNPVTDDLLIEVAFEPIKQQLKRDLRKWEEIKNKRSEAGKASAESKKLAKEKKGKSTKSTSVESDQQDLTKSTVNDTVNVTVNDIKESINTPSKDGFVDPLKFVTYFNSIGDRQFKVTDKVKAALKARLKDYTKEEIAKAIQKAHKDPYHIENNFKYLTPEFILRPEKLEMFLNQSSTTTGLSSTVGVIRPLN